MDLSDVFVTKATHYHLLEISVKVSLWTSATDDFFFNKISSISAIGVKSFENGVERCVASLFLYFTVNHSTVPIYTATYLMDS